MARINWVESVFCKRECSKYIPSAKDNSRCCCGLLWQYHRDGSPATLRKFGSQEIQWSPNRYTQLFPTDAYGTLEFLGGPHPAKAQYIRLSHDTPPQQILDLLTREWGLSLPKLLISIQGGKANFDLQPKLKRVIRKGLVKAAKTTGAWVITGGTDTGVTRQVGEAFASETSLRGSSSRVISIGIAPWGIVERRQDLIGRNADVNYHIIHSPRSKLAVLNRYHSFFLLVDNGTAGKYGAEIILRRKLENYISKQRIETRGGLATPVVCVVIEGGPQTIRQVLEYVTDSPPLPVIVCDGTGRAADLIAFVHKYSTSGQGVLENNRVSIVTAIERVFDLRPLQAEKLFVELLQCVRKKDLITVFRVKEGSELDQSILSALLYSKHLTLSEQLSLALTWNRVDIARTHLFDENIDWPEASLEQAMMDALSNDRIEFVKLLLEQGVSIKNFLTVERLEELYNSKQGPPNTLADILKDVRNTVPKDYKYTLVDIGLVINKLMGGAFRSSYSRKKFRCAFAHLRPPIAARNGQLVFPKAPKDKSQDSILENQAESPNSPTFEYPFSELMLWAVLTKRHEMSLLMWQHGEEAVGKALVAAKLYKALAHERSADDFDADISELKNYAKEYETLALQTLDYCYKLDQNLTNQLLTYELKNWSKKTCLALAVAVNHRAFLAHPCCQILLADLWLGGLRSRRNTNLTVILALLFPPIIFYLGFRSHEELRSMPQTCEEHWEEEQNWYSDTSSSDSESGLDNLDARHDQDPEVPLCPDSVLPGTRTSSLNHSRTASVLDMTSKGSQNGNPINGFFCFGKKKSPEVTFSEPHSKEINLKTKIYEFYNAPITKFWAYSGSYVVFLCVFTFMVLVKLPPFPLWPEWYVFAFICTSLMEKIREILAAEPAKIKQKLEVWSEKLWNVFDVIFTLLFILGFCLRLQPDLDVRNAGRVIYCVDIVYWYLKVLEILSANKYLGPLVMMMGKMVKNMAYFVILLLVVLMAFGVCRQSILFPNEKPHWRLARHIFYQPYFMLYGEVFAGDIDPPCGGPGEVECQPGRWITPTVMSMYLLIANILLINLLIAVFNNIFTSVNAISHQVWMFQRFQVVMGFEEKPVFPPPFILISHFHRVFRYFYLKSWKRKPYLYGYGLKRFLDGENLERVHDFEEECLDAYMREKVLKDQMSTEERVRVMSERIEMLSQRSEETHTKFLMANGTLNNLDFHVKRLQDALYRTHSHYVSLRRVLAKHFGDRIPSSISDGLERTSTSSSSESDEKDDQKEEIHKEEEEERIRGRHGSLVVKMDLTYMKVEDKMESEEPKIRKDSRKRIRNRKKESRVFANKSSFRSHPKRSRIPSEESFTEERKKIPSRTISRSKSHTTSTSETSLPEYRCRHSSLSSSAMEFNRPVIHVIPPPSPPAIVSLAAEYTSLGDQLESVCMTRLTPPPVSPRLFPELRTRPRYLSESGVSCMASIEINPLRDAEESDYHLMEGIIQRRMHRDSENLAVSLEDLFAVFSSLSEDEEGDIDTEIERNTQHPSSDGTLVASSAVSSAVGLQVCGDNASLGVKHKGVKRLSSYENKLKVLNSNSRKVYPLRSSDVDLRRCGSVPETQFSRLHVNLGSSEPQLTSSGTPKSLHLKLIPATRFEVSTPLEEESPQQENATHLPPKSVEDQNLQHPNEETEDNCLQQPSTEEGHNKFSSKENQLGQSSESVISVKPESSQVNETKF